MRWIALLVLVACAPSIDGPSTAHSGAGTTGLPTSPPPPDHSAAPPLETVDGQVLVPVWKYDPDQGCYDWVDEWVPLDGWSEYAACALPRYHCHSEEWFTRGNVDGSRCYRIFGDGVVDEPALMVLDPPCPGREVGWCENLDVMTTTP